MIGYSSCFDMLTWSIVIDRIKEVERPERDFVVNHPKEIFEVQSFNENKK